MEWIICWKRSFNILVFHMGVCTCDWGLGFHMFVHFCWIRVLDLEAWRDSGRAFFEYCRVGVLGFEVKYLGSRVFGFEVFWDYGLGF